MSFDLPLGQQAATVTRFTVGDYTSGDYVDAVESTFDISGSFQFQQGRERQLAEEGSRNVARLKLYCGTDQPTLDTASNTPGALRRADRILLNGRNYEVTEVFDWLFDVGGCPHMEYDLHLVGKDEPG